MFSAMVPTYLLLASAAFAAPSFEPDRRSNTPQHLDGTFTAATGLISIPTFSGSGGISARVAIDAYSCQNGSLQTGVNSIISQEGKQCSFIAWYRWTPKIFNHFPNITLSSGDSVRLTVNTSSPNTGTATIENLTTNVTVSKVLHSRNTLCQQDVEWMVQVADVIPKIGTFVFSKAGASTQNGRNIGPGGSNLVEIVRAGQVVNSSVDLASGNVTIAYNA